MTPFIINIIAFVSKNYKVFLLLYNGLELLYKFLKQENMGLWSKKAEKGFSQFIDDKLKLPIWAEPFDGMLANYGIGWLDGKYSSKIPSVLQPSYIKIGLAFEQYNSDKKIAIEDLIDVADVANIINALIDIPSMTEEEEGVLMAAVLQGLFTVVKNYIEKKKAEKK